MRCRFFAFAKTFHRRKWNSCRYCVQLSRLEPLDGQEHLENLASRKDAKPRTVDEPRLDALLAHLMSRGDITVDGGKVEYRLAG